MFCVHVLWGMGISTSELYLTSELDTKQCDIVKTLVSYIDHWNKTS